MGLSDSKASIPESDLLKILIRKNTVEELSRLEDLDLSEEQLGEIDVFAFQHVPKLRDLNLSWNKLKQITAVAFKPLVKLEKLDLSWNEINEIEASSFVYLVNLKWLDLSSCSLRRIHRDAFRGLTNLEGLRLSLNELDELNDPGMFESLVRLQFLWLDNNQLVWVDRKCLEKLPRSIRGVSVYYNRLRQISFVNSDATETDFFKHQMTQLNENRFLTNWDTFLDQFKN